MRLAILDDYQDVALALAGWQRLAPDLTVQSIRDPFASEDDAAARLADADIIVAMRERTPFPASLLRRLPRLKLLVTTGMRNAVIDVAAATERGVTVSGTEMLGYPTAELAWGLVLALARNIPREDRGMRAGAWQSTVGVGLRGKTLGLVGLGRLGTEVAGFGRAFGMDVVAWSPNLDAAKAQAAGARRVEKAELFTAADVVSIHLVLGPRSRGVVGRTELAAMKPTAFLVNTSRGPVVDGVALIDALEQGRIAGAGLDVYDHEPLPPDHALRRLENVVLTPHLGYVTTENYRQCYGQALEDVEAFLAGRPIRTLGAKA